MITIITMMGKKNSDIANIVIKEYKGKDKKKKVLYTLVLLYLRKKQSSTVRIRIVFIKNMLGFTENMD